ncbi:hypothetical protein [Mucilaginibacter rubeus]|uniref:Pentapeptide repeat-containing protein n=1 Tax=Mucilaginibacter rubeus TaxID=2027860 RepID=A0A5C1I6H1_9SPHI|nr:hypothetical protein [Mucilaginibacter rubeus]QEM12960.1 hypothetical protein DEO27_024090 [Mucilaginibacter rubeus]
MAKTRDELELEELQAKINKLKKEIKILDNQILMQEDDKNEAKKRITKLDKEISILDNQIPNVTEKNEAKRKIDKLNEEIKILEYQTSKKYKNQESLKAFASIASAATVIVSLVAIGFSIYQYYQTSKLTLDSKKEDRLAAALANIGDTVVRKRLTGVIALKSFISVGDSLKNTQALLSLAHALGIESDGDIRGSILEVFSSDDMRKVDTSILKEVTKSLIIINRKLYLEKKSDLDTIVHPDSLPISRLKLYYDKINATSDAIVALLSYGFEIKDMSSTYFYNKKFIRLKGYNLNLSNAYLKSCGFFDMICQKCSFENANLFGTRFMGGDMSGSDFSLYYQYRESSANSHYKNSDTFGIFFSDINLTNANFDCRPMFLYVPSDIQFKKIPWSVFSSFVNVNVDSADFSRMGVWYYKHSDSVRIGTDTLTLAYKEMYSVPALVGNDRFLLSTSKTNWNKAILSGKFSEYIKRNPKKF